MAELSAPERLEGKSLKERLFAPTDIASMVFLRVSLGLVFVGEVVRYFVYGWIRDDFIDPQVHFTYYGFGWVSPWPGWGMYAHFVVMGLAGLGLMLGCFYRISAILTFLTFTYVFLLDQAQYLNHFYLMCLLAFLMIFLPAHRAGSVDAWRKPQIRSDFIPAWPRALMLAFISLVYFYAGIAKLNADWFEGGALRIWLPRAEHLPVLGPHLDHELAAYFFAYGGLAFDLFIVPLLLWRRTRWLGYLWALAFHFLNFLIFDIGVFPWMMMLATTFYFSPDWPRRWIKWPSTLRSTATEDGRHSEPVAVAFHYSPVPIRLGVAFLIFQALFPLRHCLYPGPVNWNEEGHRFSWHMMLRTKSGTARFMVTDPVTKETWEVRPSQYLTDQQTRKVATRPDMLLQFAHFLARAEAAAHNRTDPLEVRVLSRVSLDGRPRQPMVYPEIDLAKVRRHLGHNHWIVPLMSEEEAAKLPPLPKRRDRGRDIATPTTTIEPLQVVSASPVPVTNSVTNLAIRVYASNTVVVAPRPGDALRDKLVSLEKTASQGDARAQYDLANLLRNGVAGVTDLQKAFSWNIKAAEAGLPEAQYQAALDFMSGQGTETNVVQAMTWSTLAARKGHEDATALKDKLRERLSPFQAMLAKRLVSDYALAARTNSP